jgi:hypothetical protein
MKLVLAALTALLFALPASYAIGKHNDSKWYQRELSVIRVVGCDGKVITADLNFLFAPSSSTSFRVDGELVKIAWGKPEISFPCHCDSQGESK